MFSRVSFFFLYSHRQGSISCHAYFIIFSLRETIIHFLAKHTLPSSLAALFEEPLVKKNKTSGFSTSPNSPSETKQSMARQDFHLEGLQRISPLFWSLIILKNRERDNDTKLGRRGGGIHAFFESNQAQIDICSSNSCYVTLLENTSPAKPAHNEIKNGGAGAFLRDLAFKITSAPDA